MGAFWDLIGDRPSGFGDGRIQWMTIWDYCYRQGIEGEQREDMLHHIQALDTAYLEFRRRKSEGK